jgi:hypothetical protein
VIDGIAGGPDVAQRLLDLAPHPPRVEISCRGGFSVNFTCERKAHWIEPLFRERWWQQVGGAVVYLDLKRVFHRRERELEVDV